MSIVHKGEITVGTKSKVVFLTEGAGINAAVMGEDAPSFIKVKAADDLSNREVALWGADNLLPQRLTKDIKSTGVLDGGIDTKARILIGKGPMPARISELTKEGYEVLEFVANPEISLFLEDNRAYDHSIAITKDLLGFGNAFIQIVLSKDRSRIVMYKRVDPNTCRFEKMNDDGVIEHVFVNADWSQFNDTEDGIHVQKVPLLDMDMPFQDLQQRETGHVFMICVQYELTGRNYYATSPWQAARKWVKIAQGIPEMKAAMFNNQITLKYIVEIHPKFWEAYDPTFKTSEPAKQKAIQDKFYEAVDEMLVGGKNQYKSLFSTTVFDSQTQQPVSAIKITPLDDKVKDGKLLPESGAANGEILFALCINPALVGASTPGGLYSGGAGSGSNIREAFLVQVMLGETERRKDSHLYNVIKRFNAWPKDIVIRYPNQILTTLNSGANTQPTA